jgi:hypothetical protein
LVDAAFERDGGVIAGSAEVRRQLCEAMHGVPIQPTPQGK